MDIKPIPLPGLVQHVAPDVGPGGGRDHDPAETEQRVVPTDRPEASSADRQPQLPLSKRVELHIDRSTRQVFGRVVNRDTGEEVREIPPKELRNLQARTRELISRLVDETA